MTRLAFPSNITPMQPIQTSKPLTLGQHLQQFGSGASPMNDPALIRGQPAGSTRTTTSNAPTLNGQGAADAITGALLDAVEGAQGTPNIGILDGIKNAFWDKKDGLNMESLGSLSEIIGSFGNVWAAMQANKLAKDTLNFKKDAYEKNMANQISSYNLALEDRMGARYAQNNRSPEEARAKINQHKLGS